MRRIALILVSILAMGIARKNLDLSLISLIKEANSSCVVYDFENNSARVGKPVWTDEERRIVLQALNNHRFSFCAEKDTILIWRGYTDYLVHEYRTSWLRKKYCSIPITIHAYSSQGELHLSHDHGEEYAIIPMAEKGGEDTLSIIIKANDLDSFRTIYDNYHERGLGSGGNQVLRMEVSGNKTVSLSEWIFELNEIFAFENLLNVY